MPNRMEEMIGLDDLRQKLAYMGWNRLGLKGLTPLRIEVQNRIDKLIMEERLDKAVAATGELPYVHDVMREDPIDDCICEACKHYETKKCQSSKCGCCGMDKETMVRYKMLFGRYPEP